MHPAKYLYTFTYDKYEVELAKLEASYLFGQEDDNKLLWTNKKIEPEISAYIKQRLDLIASDEDYPTLIEAIKSKGIIAEGFKAEYLVLEGDTTEYADRLNKLKDVGFSINSAPDYYKPTIIFTLCYYEGLWCFGTMIKDKFEWYKHKKKPHSYSNSLGTNVAKALINIAAKGDKKNTLIDTCCGAGTIMLEACFVGYNIEGCDINWKLCRSARANLAYFDYTAPVYRSDIKDIDKNYDAAIVDLPYNLLSQSTEEDTGHIITSAAAVTDRLVIVSTTDISEIIKTAGLRILETCSVGKRGKTVFVRRVWVCERR